MRRLIIAFCVCACCGCGSRDSTEGVRPTADSLENRNEYTCPMHPEVIRPRAGKCPECNMELNIRS
ncbi:MAG: heavy metal-binding domain-containing protein [Bacteroidota bacterium]